MKLLYLRTPSFQCDPHVGSLEQYVATKEGWQLRVENYHVVNQDEQILRWVLEFKPNYVICLGTAGGPFELSEKVLLWIKEMEGTKTILLCPEASNPGWHSLLAKYLECNCFSLILNLDGVDPRIPGILNTLALFDQRPYENPKSWHERMIDIGFCGGGTFRKDPGPLPLSHRENLIAHLKTFPNFRELEFKDVPGTYQKYADFMMDCKIAINSSGSSGDASNHVKGRVIEAGLAGCLLFEDGKSPLRQWISPHAFVTYTSLEELAELTAYYLTQVGESTQIAARLSKIVREQFSPLTGWSWIFERT